MHQCKNCEAVLFKGNADYSGFGLTSNLEPIDEHVKILKIDIDADPSTNMSDLFLQYECRKCGTYGSLSA